MNTQTLTPEERQEFERVDRIVALRVSRPYKLERYPALTDSRAYRLTVSQPPTTHRIGGFTFPVARTAIRTLLVENGELREYGAGKNSRPSVWGRLLNGACLDTVSLAAPFGSLDTVKVMPGSAPGLWDLFVEFSDLNGRTHSVLWCQDEECRATLEAERLAVLSNPAQSFAQLDLY